MSYNEQRELQLLFVFGLGKEKEKAKKGGCYLPTECREFSRSEMGILTSYLYA